jgi:hypothetical protein
MFYFTDLVNNNYKYFLIDYYNNKFSLYNLDHSAYLLNITPVAPLDSGLYDIAYITSTLFDCDSNTIEYVECTKGSNFPFYIARTDGTILFQQDSSLGPYCFGCWDGSIVMKPIYNTPDGAKLLLANTFTNTWTVFSLCGILPEALNEIQSVKMYVQVYPNPSSGIITFKIDSPNNFENYEFTIYDALLQKIKSEMVSGIKIISFDNSSLNSGVYFFSLQSAKKIIQSGKFIITK